MTERTVDINNIEELVKAIAGFAYDKKARDIIGIDLAGISPVTDYFVICSGSNKPQIKAICATIEDKLAEQGLEPSHIEGFQDASWILMDYGAVIVHVFQPQARQYYDLERLWKDGTPVDLSGIIESEA